MDVFESIKENQLIAIVRGAQLNQISKISDALALGGIRILEITTETANAIEVIREAVKQSKQEVVMGAGTVLDGETARAAILAGAQFIVSPIVREDIIKMCNRYGVLSIIGALTPTEILTAYENGADVVKVFPASAFGPKYLKDLSGPLPHIPLIPTGGIQLDNVKEYLDASQVGVGLGSSLVNTTKLVNDQDYEELIEKAKKFKQAIQ